MRRQLKWLGAVVALAGSAGPVRGQIPDRVGPLGAASCINILGNAAFPAEDIQWALAADFDVALAAHPAAPLTGYLTTLKNRCRDGYQRHGFPQAKVDVSFHERSGNVRILVREGPRLVMRDIRIVGTRRVGAAQLRDLLTRDEPVGDPLKATKIGEDTAVGDAAEETKPAWQRGEPADCSSQGYVKYGRAINAALAKMGFHHAVFETQVLFDLDRQQADLRISFLDEGEPALVDEVIVTGLERNSRAALLREIDWRDDRLVTSVELNRINERLHLSGRFVTHHVRVAPPDGTQRKFRLLIDVLEYPRVTPLGQPLTDVERILMKHYEWLEKFEHQGLDFIGEGSHDGYAARLIFSQREGLLLQWSRKALDGQRPRWSTIVLMADQLSCFLAGHNETLVAPLPPQCVVMNADLGLTDKEDRNEMPFRFTFGFQISSGGQHAAPFLPQFNVTPAFCLAQAYEHQAKCSLRDGVLDISGDSGSLRIEASTGLPLLLTINQDNGEPFKGTFAAGAFARELAIARASTKGKENAFDGVHPVRSMLKYFLHDTVLRDFASLAGKELPADKPVLEPPLRSAIVKFIETGVFDGWGSFSAEAEPPANRFSLSPTVPESSDQVQTYARFFVPAADMLFPRESWPATIWREACLLLAGEPKYFQQELGRLYDSPETGPVGSLAAAALATMVSREAGQTFAQQGLKRLTAADFRNDYAPLLDDQSGVGAGAQHLLDALRNFNDDELAAVGRLIVGERTAEFVAAAKIMRENRERPAAEVLPVVLDRVWELGLRKEIETHLRQYAR